MPYRIGLAINHGKAWGAIPIQRRSSNQNCDKNLVSYLKK